MTIQIKRTYLPKVTTGIASIGHFNFNTIELPWLDNQTGISCIPEGIYDWEIYQSPVHGKVILIKDVSNRNYIEIHVGNFTREIRGCILPGDNHTDIDQDGIIDVTSSRVTMNKILSICGESGTIEFTS